MTRRLGDHGVSPVVAAVLLFALFSTAMLLWTLNTLPGWIEDKEHAHQVEVRDRFTDMQAGLERLAANDDAGPLTVTLPLGTPKVPLVQKTQATGILGIEDGVGLAATFTNPQLHIVADSLTGPPDAAAGTSLTEVTSISVLQVRLSTQNVGNNDDGWVQLTATDGLDTVTATLTHTGRNGATSCNDGELALSITSGVGTNRYVLLCNVGSDLDGQTVDLLDTVYGFRGALAGLDTPYSITTSQGASGGGTSATGTFAAAWQDSDGRTHVIGGGTSSPGYALDEDLVSVFFEPQYQEAVSQTLRWEAGAVVADQADGSVLVRDPGFDLQVDGGAGYLRWTWTVLDGDAASTQGAGSQDLLITHTGTNRVVLTADGATFTVDGATADAWRTMWSQEAAFGGAGGDVATGGDDDTATLTLGTGVSSWTIDLRIIRAQVTVR